MIATLLSSYLFREESLVWAARYDLSAVRDGLIKRDVVPDHTPSAAQGWFFNTRLEKLKDRRVREAFIDAFDFEWTNTTIMYGAYQRDLAPTYPPSSGNRAI